MYRSKLYRKLSSTSAIATLTFYVLQSSSMNKCKYLVTVTEIESSLRTHICNCSLTSALTRCTCRPRVTMKPTPRFGKFRMFCLSLGEEPAWRPSTFVFAPLHRGTSTVYLYCAVVVCSPLVSLCPLLSPLKSPSLSIFVTAFFPVAVVLLSVLYKHIQYYRYSVPVFSHTLQHFHFSLTFFGREREVKIKFHEHCQDLT